MEELVKTQLNPEAEPFVPTNEVTVVAVQVESENPVDPPASVSSEPPVEEEQEALLWSTEGLIAAQKADPDIGLMYQLVESGASKPSWNDIVQYSKEVKTLWSFWPRLSVRDGLLQRKFTCIEQQSEFWQTIVPRRYHQEFIKRVHTGATGGHFGVKKTSASVQSRTYWPSWSSDVETFVKKCAVSAQYHRGALPRQAALQTPVVGEPWERISIDITGPHPKSSRQNVYILTLVDHFTKWAEAIAILNHTAATVAKDLMVHVFSRYGLPAEVLSDGGTEFESELFAQLMRWLEVDKLRTAAYKPSTYGVVERFHRTLNTILGKLVSTNQRDWDERLPYALMPYRATIHSSTGFTPNKLFLGRESRLPVDLLMGLPVSEVNGDQTMEEYVEKQQYLAEETFQLVRENLNRNAQRRKSTYDAKVRESSYAVGDSVCYCYSRK